MAWIESHQELAGHPKTKKFARRLGISLPAAVGHLHFFWWWAMDYAQDGDLTKYDADDIADACGWDGDSSDIQSALIEVGFIDDDMHIHDWFDYAGRLIEKKQANKVRMRNARASNVQSTTNTRAWATGPNLTEHDHTVTDQTKEDRENDHARLLSIYNEMKIQGGGALGLDKVYSYIGVVDLEVIELALKAAEGKHVNYFVSTINGWIAKGKTTVALVNDIPQKGEYRGTGPPRRGTGKPLMTVVENKDPQPEITPEQREKMLERARRLAAGKKEDG